MSPSRTGKKWSKYRCHCGSTIARSCTCGDLSRDESKRVTFKELARRNLAGLFSVSSIDRIHSPLPYAWRSPNLYGGTAQ